MKRVTDERLAKMIDFAEHKCVTTYFSDEDIAEALRELQQLRALAPNIAKLADRDEETNTPLDNDYNCGIRDALAEVAFILAPSTEESQ